jgi:hypothetical protein
MQEKAFFIGLTVFLLWIAAETAVIYSGARLARIGGNSLPRAFLAALTSGFALLLVISFARDSVGASLPLWLAMYTVIVLPIIALCLRAGVFKVIVPWLGAVLLLGAAFLAWRLLPGN